MERHHGQRVDRQFKQPIGAIWTIGPMAPVGALGWLIAAQANASNASNALGCDILPPRGGRLLYTRNRESAQKRK